MNLNKAIRDAAAKQAGLDSRPLPRASTKREASLNELDAKYHPQGYGLYFCLHDKSYYEVCQKCHRTKVDAANNLSHL